MSDDDPEQKQTSNKQEKADDREEREYRRGNKENESVLDDSIGAENTFTSTDDLESDGEAIQGKDEEQLDVPQITVELASKLDSADLISELLVGGDSVQIPQIQTQSAPRPKAGDITETIPPRSETDLPSVPQFSQNTTDRLTPVELDNEQVDGVERVQKVQVPQIEVENWHRIQPFSTFLEVVPEITPEDKGVEEGAAELIEEEEQEVVETTQVIEGAADSIDEVGAGTEWIEGDWPDPLELLFGSGGTDIKSSSPLVIKVDGDGLVGVVETLVKRRYREIEGGEPDLKKFNTADQLANEERWMSADSQIFTAQLLDEEWKKLEEDHQEEWQSIWNNKVDQLFSGQRFGAIIFNRTNLPSREVMSLPHHPPTLVELENVVDWKDIARVFWTGLSNEALRFSQVFDWDTNGVAKDRRLQILQALDGKFDFATNSDDEASDEHYALKVFAVKCLAEELWEAGREFSTYDDLSEIKDYREIEKTILTERPLPTDDNPIRPDVRYGSQVFEVEMFFGEGDENGVVAKLQDTVRKYEEVNDQIDTINIVVDNLTCLLHLKDLARFKRTHQAWEEDYADINFYTVDLGREELVPVNEIVNEITNLSIR